MEKLDKDGAEISGKQTQNRPPHLWKPGQSGNPSGRPKGSISLARILREELSAGNEEDARLIVRAMITVAKSATKDGHSDRQEILNRIDGKVADKVIGDGVINLITRTPGLGDKSGAVAGGEDDNAD